MSLQLERSNVKEIPAQPVVVRDAEASRRTSPTDVLAAELDTNGIVVLPTLLGPEQLRDMQRAFATRLGSMRWNNFEGYQKTEPHYGIECVFYAISREEFLKDQVVGDL